jgi:hypothetical protein
MTYQELQPLMESQSIQNPPTQMHEVQLSSTLNTVQTKPMKVPRIHKNKTHTKFQHSPESQLIELMTMKKPHLQSVSILNCAQTKQTSTNHTL